MMKKAVMVCAAIWTAICLNGCNGGSEYTAGLSRRGKEMAEYFSSFPKSYQSMLENDTASVYL